MKLGLVIARPVLVLGVIIMQHTKSKLSSVFSYDGSFYDLCGRIFDLLAVSIYFIIGSLPVITIGDSFAALYYTVEKSIRENRETVTRSFWSAYRTNFKQSFFLELIVGAAGFAMLLNLGIVNARFSGKPAITMLIFYGILFGIVVATACYVFPTLSRFEAETGWFLKIGLYMTFRYLPVTLLVVGLAMISYMVVYMVPPLILFLPGPAALLSTFLIEPILKKHMPSGVADESKEAP